MNLRLRVVRGGSGFQPRVVAVENRSHPRSRLLLISVFIAGCSSLPVKDSAPPSTINVDAIPDAVPRDEPRSKYGNPASYSVNGDTYEVLASADGYIERGIASWYGNKFHGQRTSSGETYDMYAMTAAHRSLPLPSYARVTNLKNQRSVVVKINDRGPFHDNRLIDLSWAAATKLDITGSGTGLVEVRVLDARHAQPSAPTETPAETPRLYVQLGAYTQPENAQRIADELKGHGFMPRITQARRGAENLHRVRLGPLPSVELADDLARKLLQLGYSKYRVIVD